MAKPDDEPAARPAGDGPAGTADAAAAPVTGTAAGPDAAPAPVAPQTGSPAAAAGAGVAPPGRDGAAPAAPGPGPDSGGAPGPGRARINPWPDRIALIFIWLAGIAITVLYQRPKGAGLYAEFWFGLMITLALLLGYVMAKRVLGLPPVTLKLRRPARHRPARR